MFSTGLLSGLMALSLAADRDPSVNPAGGSETFPLWKDKAPLAVGGSRFDKPQLTLYKPKEPNGAAVVICPGGGYGFLATDHEGRQAAEYFAKIGVTAFVLQYRIAQPDRPGPLTYAPLFDAQRALRTVRFRAKEYGVDPKKVGLMGFSAGGHLASTAGTHFDSGLLKDHLDDTDLMSSRPDWLVLAYPVVTTDKGVTHGGSLNSLLGKEPKAEDLEYFSNEKHVTKDTPPTFLFHTDEDTGVLPENSVRFYLALKKAKVPAELHIYAKGQHGIGLGTDPAWTGKGPNADYCAAWADHLTAWLKAQGVIGKADKK